MVLRSLSIIYIYIYILNLVPRTKNVGVTQTNERTKVKT
jgi:hypothetical protein